MKNKCIVSEHIPSLWKSLITGGLIAAILSILLLITTEDPLTVGILKLIAFAGFTMVVLSYLQIRVEPQEIELQFDGENLLIEYYTDSEKTQKELFEIETISNVIRINNPPVWKILRCRECCKFLITFTDRANTLSLFRIEGRDVCVFPPDAEKVERFLKDYMNYD